MFKTTIAVVLFILLAAPAMPADRCEDYRVDVRIESIKQWGYKFPYWYSLGQLQQESRCRNVIAFDGGQGIAQFMPQTAKYVQDQTKIKLDPMNPKQAIRMQAWYMKKIHKQNWNGALWLTYQGYNGGFKLLQKEAQRAGVCDHDKMREVCSRKVIQLKSGPLDLCDVNYDYSLKVYKYGQKYRTGPDAMSFW